MIQYYEWHGWGAGEAICTQTAGLRTVDYPANQPWSTNSAQLSQPCQSHTGEVVGYHLVEDNAGVPFDCCKEVLSQLGSLKWIGVGILLNLVGIALALAKQFGWIP